MAKRIKKAILPARTATEVRDIILRYFYERNAHATSARGKKGFAIKIRDIRAELKEGHGLSASDVVGNLNYLISQGWIEEERVEKSVPLPTGTVIPQSTSFYKITAAGIDKIEGPGEYTRDRFAGIKIEATGQNIVTIGNGNRINAKFADAGQALLELRQAILAEQQLTESQKLDAVADIDCIESQLAKPSPNSSVVSGAWSGIKALDTVLGLAEKIGKAAMWLAPLLGHMS